METRLAHIGIIVEDKTAVGTVNALLSSVGDYIVGRMGIPYRPRHLNIISIVIDAPMDVLNSLNGKLGKVPGVSSKILYPKGGGI